MPLVTATSGDIDVVSHSAAQTQRLGARLGALCAPGAAILLDGDLGTGKTVFAKGIAEGLGVTDHVSSPTFAIIHQYNGRLPLAHVDLYRLEGNAAAISTGLEDYLRADGVTVVEWPSRAPDVFGNDYVVVSFRHLSETKRGVRISPHGSSARELVAQFRREAFGV
jgi:tRNA threonylcarbamoyladenosine biosynthesis protein TsaE